MIYTVAQISRLLSVKPETVIKWHDGGHLQGYTLDNGERRFPKPNVVEFLVASGQSLEHLESRANRRVAVFGVDPEEFDRMQECVGNEVDLILSNSALSLREHIEGGFSDCVVISEDSPAFLDAVEVANSLQVTTIGITLSSASDSSYTVVCRPDHTEAISQQINKLSRM